MAEERKDEEVKEEFHSAWDKQGIHDIPTLMNTALKIERPQGGGFFTKAYNDWMDKAKNEFYQSVEKNAELKRYYMPEERESITTEEIKATKAQNAKDVESIEKSKANYVEKFGKLNNGQATADPDKINKAAQQAQGQNKKGPTPTSIFKMNTEFDSNVAEFDKKKASVQAKGEATVINMMKEQRIGADLPLARAMALKQDAEQYAKDKFKMKKAKAQMIANPIQQVAEVAENVGGIISHGRNYRRG